MAVGILLVGQVLQLKAEVDAGVQDAHGPWRCRDDLVLKLVHVEDRRV